MEASKFTEVGYVGRDVESMIRDLVEIGIKQTRELAMKKVRVRAEDAAEERVLGALIPVLTLAVSSSPARVMFGGGYVVDDFSLVLKALFLIATYVVILMSTTYVDEGDYYEGEYYLLLLTSSLGMMTMASSRDLISIFVALEFLSIPAYMLAGWRKRDTKSNEASVKYYLLGVFASAVMLYGMSLLYGTTKTTVLAGIADAIHRDGVNGATALAIVFILIGFAFKVSAVPFHMWTPDVYQGAPTPVTAFMAAATKVDLETSPNYIKADAATKLAIKAQQEEAELKAMIEAEKKAERDARYAARKVPTGGSMWTFALME